MRTPLFLILLGTFSSAALAGTGQIHVVAPGAPGEIVLDGFPTGMKAPATLDGVPTGQHEIEVKYGCMVGKGRVPVAEGKLAEASLEMDNVGGQGTVRIRNLPDGSEVWVDDVPVLFPERRAEIACGAHRLMVEGPGILPWQETIVVTSGKWTQVDGNFETERLEREESNQRPNRKEPLDEEAMLEADLDENYGGDPEEDFSFDDTAGYETDEFVDEFDRRSNRDSDFAPRTPEELKDLDGGWIPKSSDGMTLTKRVGFSTGMVALGAVGSYFMVTGVAENNLYVDEWKSLFEFEPTSSDAQTYWNKNIRPVRIKAGLGSAAAVLGFGGAAATMFFLDGESGGMMMRVSGEF